MAKQQTKELTEEQKLAISNYSNDIITMKDFVSLVRKRPGYQIGGIGNRGFLNMIRELVQNSLDQIMDPTSPGSWCSLIYDMRTLEVTVSDNGKGLPISDMVRMLTKEYTSKNYEKRKGEYSSGLHGAGAKIVAALSLKMVVSTYFYTGEAAQLTIEKGYPTTKDPVLIKNKDNKQGTSITFMPDLDIMGHVDLDWSKVYNLFKHIMSITPIGSEMDFCAIDMNGVEHKEHIVNTDGIITDLILKVKSPIIKPIVVGFDDGEHKLEAAFTYDGGDEKSGIESDVNVTAFCNFCPTIGGTHIDGTVEGICRWFTNYMNKIYLINQTKNKVTITFADIKSGLNIMIAAAHLEPIFGSQAKDIMTNEDMIPFCKDVVMNGLDEWSKSNPQDLSKLCKYFKDIADARMKMDKEKIKIVTKYQQNTITGMPAKYCKPSEECRELLIVEGDSAGGSAKQARAKEYQAVFPLRGKIPSAFEKSKQVFWDNAETQGIARIILGHDYTKNFDVNEVKWEKIIFMADADVDGSHISSLLLRFFVLYMPKLIEAGKVYKAVPPLYGIKNGKKIQYFTSQIDFVKFIQKSFIQNNSIKDIKTKKPIENKDITVLFLVNEDYVYELERLAQTYGVDPGLLELALFNYCNNTAIGTLKKDIKSKYRFMDSYTNKAGSIIYEGTIKESNFLVMNDRLIKDCKRILDIINKNKQFYYLMNDKECSIYTIMKVFEKSIPSNLSRYKGLGEMNHDQLAQSTILPDERTLIRYTLEDAKEELSIIREFESDRSKLLDFVGTVKRADLLD